MSEISSQLDAARERLRDQAAAYLTVEEAAQLARCNPKTIRRAFHSGALRAFQPARRVLLREADVRDWVESRTVIAPSRPRPRQRRGRPTLSPGSVAELREMDREAR